MPQSGHGEKVDVEIVAYGPGLHMLRADTSQVKDRIKDMAGQYSSIIKFSACNNTKQAMEKREGHAISIIPEATMVDSGVVQLMERQGKAGVISGPDGAHGAHAPYRTKEQRTSSKPRQSYSNPAPA